MMTRTELIRALKGMKAETGSLICLGCGHERNCTIKGCAIIRAAVKELEKMRWVPVEERLPEEGQVVAIAIETNIATFFTSATVFLEHFGFHKDVRYWMPLPELPEVTE